MDVSRVAGEKFIYLTTTGRTSGSPHTVELWFAVAGKKVYLSHEGAYTDWMKNILEDSRVEFKIGKSRFKGTARIAKDDELLNWENMLSTSNTMATQTKTQSTTGSQNQQ